MLQTWHSQRSWSLASTHQDCVHAILPTSENSGSAPRGEPQILHGPLGIRLSRHPARASD